MSDPGYLINEVTTIWSQETLVAIVRAKNEDFDFQDGNKKFGLVREYTEAWGVRWFLTYGYKKVLHLGLSDSLFEWQLDTPKLEKQFDQHTNTNKFRLYIDNATGQGLRKIVVRPEAYNPAWPLAWAYIFNRDGEIGAQHVIEVSRVDEGGQKHLIYTLKGADFGPGGRDWFKGKKPIVIQKHKTYITVHASRFLKEQWAALETFYVNTRISAYTLLADENAWISDDEAKESKSLEEVSLFQHADMRVMLATLQEMTQ